ASFGDDASVQRQDALAMEARRGRAPTCSRRRSRDRRMASVAGLLALDSPLSPSAIRINTAFTVAYIVDSLQKRRPIVARRDLIRPVREAAASWQIAIIHGTSFTCRSSQTLITVVVDEARP